MTLVALDIIKLMDAVKIVKAVIGGKAAAAVSFLGAWAWSIPLALAGVAVYFGNSD